jgi:hypothetical protein
MRSPSLFEVERSGTLFPLDSQGLDRYNMRKYS